MADNGNGCVPLDGFSPVQKATMRVCLYGFFVTGLFGVFVESMLWGWLYLVFLALMGVIVLRVFCARCPYPYTYKTCLAMPHRVVAAFSRNKPDAMRVWEKAAFMSVLAVGMLFPQYWLFRNPKLLALYWAFCIPTCVAFPFYFCRRCRHAHCPFNPRARKTRGSVR
ncbi:MAG: hypothetical protein JXR37_08420 [Kiritimatiellae bacterium]|nr:hypothetical protein [Kiritimatiellia bacterium]